MQGNFSEKSLSLYQDLLEFSEDTYDFTRCIRPDGSAYGTRGACQTPNRVAPKQDVSLMNQKDFISGGGVSAVGKGLSSSQVVARGRDARARAFEAGGGMAAMAAGRTREEVERSGSRARAEAYQAGGGKRAATTRAGTEAAIKQGAKNRAAAYKAGGGDAAVKAGKSAADVIKEGAASLKAAYQAGGGTKKYDTTPQGYGKADVISQGKKNIKEAFEAGGGEAARKQGLSVKEIVERGRKNLNKAYVAGGGDAARARTSDTKSVIKRGSKAIEDAAKAGGGSVRKGQDILADPMGYTKRSTLEAGGGEAMVKKIAESLTKSQGRKPNEREMERVRARVAGKGVENLRKYYAGGGGSKAVASGKTVDEVIREGEKIVEGAKLKKAEQAARTLRNKLDRGSQFT